MTDVNIDDDDGGFAPARRAKRHRGPSGVVKALIGLGALVLVLVLVVAIVLLVLQHRINSQITHIPDALPSTAQTVSPAPNAAGKPINVLVMGSDSRQSGGDPSNWQYGAQRSDVLMLVQISGDRKSVNIMSIPRDSWVPIQGHGTAKINAAFSYGGAPLAITTVQDLMGVPIDHFAVVDFTSFQEITDSLGGVTIATAAGDQRMNGAQALAFVRERYSLPNGDFDRVRRQQAWIAAIMRGVFNQNVLTSPTQVNSLIHILLTYSAVDNSLDFNQMASLAFSLRSLRPAGVKLFTAPYTGTSTSADGQSIVVLDKPLLDQVGQAWRDDRVGEFLAQNPQVQRLDSGVVY